MKHYLKNIGLWLSMFFVINLKAQPIPADSTLLKVLYGGYDVGGASFTRMLQPWESVMVLYDSVVYKIVFKQVIKLHTKEFLLVCTAAPTSAEHHHQLGYWESHAFKRIQGQWVKDLTWHTDTHKIRVLGDDTLRYKVVNIGKNKKALIETWESRGKLHYQKNIEILELSLHQIKEQGRIQIGFSNLDWEGPTEQGDCIAETVESSYEIVPGPKEWFDIKLHSSSYTYGNDCKGLILNELKDVLWAHTDQGYIIKETKILPRSK